MHNQFPSEYFKENPEQKNKFDKLQKEESELKKKFKESSEDEKRYAQNANGLKKVVHIVEPKEEKMILIPNTEFTKNANYPILKQGLLDKDIIAVDADNNNLDIKTLK